MSEVCDYCNSKLSTKGNLLFHQKNNKKCIELQKNKSTDINYNLKKCQFCNKEFSSNIIKRHLSNCKIKKEKDLENKMSEYENKISILERECENKISEYENKMSILKREYENKITNIIALNIKLETENNMYKNIYEKDHQVITTMAQQPKNNTNNNIVNNLAVYDNKTITDRFTDVLNNIKPTDLYDGQESISRFIAPCLKNDDGTQLYKCTDYSRGVYIKKDHHGNIIKDINGKNLVELIEPIASKKAVELLNEDNNKRDKQRRLRYLRKHIETQYEEIEIIRNNMKGYEIDSSSWKCQNNRIKMLENNINKHTEEQEELENEGIDELDNEVCDDKLTDGVNDIKNMQKDSSKFSKKLSKLL